MEVVAFLMILSHLRLSEIQFLINFDDTLNITYVS